MDPLQSEIEALREVVRQLIVRVNRLEQAAGVPPPVPTAVAPPPEPPPSASVRQEQPRAAEDQLPPPAAVLETPAQERTRRVRIPAFAVGQTDSASLESRIGSRWLNRIGIVAMLVGVSYFLKYAFDNNWIGAGGRVAIGLVCGIAIVVWSEWFRGRGYKYFSYALKAVGIGALYLSLWAAFQVYSLIPGGVAFVAMLVVTAATVAMALTQDAEVLAVFAFVGGFVTPVLLSTGQNREAQLFTYVSVLDVAALVLVHLKPWRRLLLINFIGTLALFIGWYAEFYSRPQLNLTVGFATVFFLIFAVAPLLAHEVENGDYASAAAVLLVLPLINAASYFLELYGMLETVSMPTIAWSAVGLAAVYIGLSRISPAQRGGDAQTRRALNYLHLALAIGFLTLAIPIRLEAHWITIGWFVEAAVLLWVAQRVQSNFLAICSYIALVLGVGRLLLIDNFHPQNLILNARMATYGIAIAVLGGIAWYNSRRQEDFSQAVSHVAVVTINLLALLALSREVNDYFSREVIQRQAEMMQGSVGNWRIVRNIQVARDFAHSALWMSYGALLMVIGFWKRSAFVRWQALILIAVTAVKVFTYDVSELERGYRILSFIVLGALLLAVSFLYQRDWLKLSEHGAKASE
jgi:uncharacterized membrane protein